MIFFHTYRISSNKRRGSNKRCTSKSGALRKKSPKSESIFSRIRTEYRKIRIISPYSVRMWKNRDQKKLRIWTLFMQCSILDIWQGSEYSFRMSLGGLQKKLYGYNFDQLFLPIGIVCENLRLVKWENLLLDNQQEAKIKHLVHRGIEETHVVTKYKK